MPQASLAGFLVVLDLPGELEWVLGSEGFRFSQPERRAIEAPSRGSSMLNADNRAIEAPDTSTIQPIQGDSVTAQVSTHPGYGGMLHVVSGKGDAVLSGRRGGRCEVVATYNCLGDGAR